MKRFVWLLIAVVCTALAQVQPVDLPAKPAQECCCCNDQAGACGMPDCAPAPVAPTCMQTLPVAAAQRAEARRLAPAPKARVDNFFARFEPRPALSPVLRVSPVGTPAASAPLFKAHCSFLI